MMTITDGQILGDGQILMAELRLTKLSLWKPRHPHSCKLREVITEH